MVETACKHCGKAFRTQRQHLGKRVRCIGCGNAFTVTIRHPEGEPPPGWSPPAPLSIPARQVDLVSLDEIELGTDAFEIETPPPLAAPPKPPKSPRPARAAARVAPSPARPRPRPDDDSQPDASRFDLLWSIVGPPDWTLWIFLPAVIFALTRLPPANEDDVRNLGVVGLLGILLACVAAFRWARVAGKNGYSGILHLIVPLYPVIWTLQNWYVMRGPAMAVVRALALVAFMIPAVQYDKAHENDPAFPAAQPSAFR